jgi:heme-degrading monooxygenase HmoA
MAICVIAENPKGHAEMYEQVMQRVAQSGDVPAPGLIFQAAGPAEPGWRVISVWDSRDAWQRFVQERLASAWAEAGLSRDDVTFTVFDVHSFMAGDLSSARRPEAVAPR